MYLLYLDEAGTHQSNYFCLCGVAVFERRTHWISSALNQIQKKSFPDVTESIELHASAMRAGQQAPWDKLSKEVRYQVIDDIYEVIRQDQVVLFATAVEKAWLKNDKDAYTWAFEGIVNRFDRFLRDKYKDEGEAQRGLIIIAESQYKDRLEEISQKVKQYGTVWGEAYNLSEIPMFTRASQSRLLQVADFCVNAIFGRFESGYTKQFDKIAHLFYENDGILRGLSHYTRNNKCMCPSCITRRNVGEKPLTKEKEFPIQAKLSDEQQ
jgi:hypothetical protein